MSLEDPKDERVELDHENLNRLDILMEGDYNGM